MQYRYHFDLLFRHSNEIANATRRDLKKQIVEARRVFGFLDQHFSALAHLIQEIAEMGLYR